MNLRPDHDGLIGDESLDLQATLTGTLSGFLQSHGMNEILTQERDYATPADPQYVLRSESDLHQLNIAAHDHMWDTVRIAQGTALTLAAGHNARPDLVELQNTVNELALEVASFEVDANHAGATLQSLLTLHAKIVDTLDPVFMEMNNISDAMAAYDLETGAPEAKYVTHVGPQGDDDVFQIDFPGKQGSVIITGNDVMRFQKILGVEAELTAEDTDLQKWRDHPVLNTQLMQGLQELRFLEDKRFILDTLSNWSIHTQATIQDIDAAFAQRDMNMLATYDFAHALRMVEKLPQELRERYQAQTVQAFLHDQSELFLDNAVYASLSSATKADHFRDFMAAARPDSITMPMLLTLGAKVTEQPAVLLENINASLRERLESVAHQAPVAAASLIFEQPGGDVEKITTMPAEAEHNLTAALKEIREKLGTPNAQPASSVPPRQGPHNLPQAIQNFDHHWNAAYSALSEMIEIAYPANELGNQRRIDLTTRIEGATKLYNRLMSAAGDAELQDGKILTRYRRQIVNAIRIMRDVAESADFDEIRAKLTLELKKAHKLSDPSVITRDRIDALDYQTSLLETRAHIISELETAGTQFLFRQARENPTVGIRRGTLYEQLVTRFAERQDQHQDAIAISEEQRKQIVTRLFDEVHSDQDVMNILGGLRVSYIPASEKSSKKLRQIVAAAAKTRDELLEHADNRWQHEQFTAAVAAQEGKLSWLATRAQNRNIRKAKKERARIESGLASAMQNLADLSYAYEQFQLERAQAAHMANTVTQEQVVAPQVEQPQPVAAPKHDEHAERLANLDRVIAQPIVGADGQMLVKPEQIDEAELERRKRSMEAAMRHGGGTAPEATTLGPIPAWLNGDADRADHTSMLPPLEPQGDDDNSLPKLLQRLKDQQQRDQRQPVADDRIAPITADDRILPQEPVEEPRRKRTLAQNLNTRARATARKLQRRRAAAVAALPAGAIDDKPKVGMPINVKNAIGAVLLGAKGDLVWAGNALGALGRMAPGIVVGAATGYGVRLATGAAATAIGSVFLTGAPLVVVSVGLAMLAGRHMGLITARFNALNRQSMRDDNSWSNAFAAPARNLAQTLKERVNGDLKMLHMQAHEKFAGLMNDAYAEVRQREADGKQTRTARTLNKVMFYPRLWAAANRIDQQTFALRVGASIGMWSAAAGALVTHALMASPVDLPAGTDQWNVHELQGQKIATALTPAEIDAPIETPVHIDNEPGKLITDRPPSAPAPVVTAPELVVTAPAPVITAPAPVTAPEPVVTAPAPVITAPAPVAPEPVATAPAPAITAPEPVVTAVAGNTNVADFVQTEGMQRVITYWEGLLAEKGKIPTSLRLQDGTTINPRKLIETRIAGARAGNLTDATALMDYTSEGGVFDKRGVFGDLRRIGPRAEDVIDVKKDLVTRFGESADPTHKWNVEHTRKFMTDMEARIKAKAPRLRPTIS